jgi:hypothetical protein
MNIHHPCNVLIANAVGLPKHLARHRRAVRRCRMGAHYGEDRFDVVSGAGNINLMLNFGSRLKRLKEII